MSATPLNIIVSGMIAGDPGQGGAVWAVLQYVLGLRALGHRVLFIEPVKRKQIQPLGGPLQSSVNANYFTQVVRTFEIEEAAALLMEDNQTTFGLAYHKCLEFAQAADLLINISGMLTDERLLAAIPRRVYLDLDPAFIQCWHDQGIDMRFAAHTHFATIGQAIGSPVCAVPTCGQHWIKTLQPVLLSHWPVAKAIVHDGLTTIANWRGYGSVEHEGVHYGQKAHSLRQFFELPSRTTESFYLALAIHPDEKSDLAQFIRFGWNLLDPAQVANTPQAYQQFIQGSKAEFGIAKSGYVLSRCGWFSDRSVCYLASGRPVLAQDTGFRDFLPTGEGLFAFQTMDDVLVAIDFLRTDYMRHANAGRTLAEDLFSHDRVLPRLLAQLD